MKITTVLTSYNRPEYLKQSVESVLMQEGPLELIVVDDMSPRNVEVKTLIFNFKNETDKEIKFIEVTGKIPTYEERMRTNRLSACINLALEHSTGDIITYLADDDYYLPDWFKNLRKAYKENPDLLVTYGIEYCSGEMGRMKSGEDCLKENPQNIRWFDSIIDPFDRLDHNQVAHSRRILDMLSRPWWPIDDSSRSGPDAYFFRRVNEEILKLYLKYEPIKIPACVKRYHSGIHGNFQSNYVR